MIQLGHGSGFKPAEVVAVLTLDEDSNILSANEAATAMFGWEASDLVGQHLRVLLKEDLGCDPRMLMHPPPLADDGAPGLSSLRVTACRKDGTEFVASIGMLQWCSDTALIRKTDGALSPWTAVFRDITDGDGEGESELSPGRDVSTTQAGEDLRQLTKENDGLKAQIVAAEAELGQVRKERDEGNEVRQQLDKKVQDLKETLEELATQFAQKREREQELQKNSAQQLDQLKAFAENAAKLDTRLRQASAEVDSLKEDREQLKAVWREERESLEQDFRAQLNVAAANLERTEAALEKEADRSRNLEEKAQAFSESIRLEQNAREQLFGDELTALQQIRDDLSSKLTAKEQALQKSEQHRQQLERQFGEMADQLKRAQTEAAKLGQERSTLLTAHQTQLDAANEERANLEAALELNLANLRAERHELYEKFRRGQEAGAKSTRRNQELEKRSRKFASALNQTKAQLKEKAAAHARLEADLQKETAARQSVEEQLRATAQVSESRQKIVASMLENARLLQSSLTESELPPSRSSAGTTAKEEPPSQRGDQRPASPTSATPGQLKT